MIIVPKFEPEISEAKAKRWRGDPDRIPTTALADLKIDGVTVVSRYRHAKELQVLGHITEMLSSEARAVIHRVFCDSKASWVVDIELLQWDARAKDVAAGFSAGLSAIVGGYNGIRVFRGLHHIDLDPWWSCDVV